MNLTFSVTDNIVGVLVLGMCKKAAANNSTIDFVVRLTRLYFAQTMCP